MGEVQLQAADVAILYCIPQGGCNLDYLVERYTCFERIAIPPYDVVAGCLDRAVRVGAVPRPTEGLYRLTPEWYARIHSQDETVSPSELAMLEVAEELQEGGWPEVAATPFVLPRDEFHRAADHTRQYLDVLFAPHRRSP
jgi:hypothetical protein